MAEECNLELCYLNLELGDYSRVMGKKVEAYTPMADYRIAPKHLLLIISGELFRIIEEKGAFQTVTLANQDSDTPE